MDRLKKTIEKLLENEYYTQNKLMVSGQFAELCKCNGRIETLIYVKNLLKCNYSIDNDI